MKHEFFAFMGTSYPSSLERDFERILIKIEALWDTPQIHDYFSDLLIDKRGGRKGFPPDVLADIIRLRDARELETFKAAERKEHAMHDLTARGIAFLPKNFFHFLEEGDQQVIDLFVRANFNVNLTAEDGTPPLITALKRGLTIIAQILLSAGADPNARDRLGLTPLLIACGKPTSGYRNAVDLLLKKGAHINVRDPLGNTPLLLSITGGTPDIAFALIEQGADVFASRRDGATALSLAQKLGDERLLRLIEFKMKQASSAGRSLSGEWAAA
jgi:tankyrase